MNHTQLSSANVGTAGAQFQSADANAPRARAAPAARLPPNDLRELRGALMRVGSDGLERPRGVELACEDRVFRSEEFSVQPVREALNDLATIARIVVFAAYSAAAGVRELCSSPDAPSEVRELEVSVNTLVQNIFRIRDNILTPQVLSLRACVDFAHAVETLQSLQMAVRGADQLYACAFELLDHITAIEEHVIPPHDQLALASRVLREDTSTVALETLRQAVFDFHSRCSMELTPDLVHAAADDAEPIFEAIAKSFDEEGLDVGAVLRALPGREDEVWAFFQRPDVWIGLMNDFKANDPDGLPVVKMPEGATAEQLETVLRAISGLEGAKPRVVIHLAPGQKCNLNLDFPQKAAGEALEIDIDCDSMAEGEIIIGPAVQVASESREPCPGIGFRTADGRDRGHLGERGSLWI